jgi:hypothetical protein
MGGYLVLEEDGISHLELEESADDLLLEEDGPLQVFVPQLAGRGSW